MQLGRFQVTDAKAFAGMINPENTLGAKFQIVSNQ